jgi:succinyl-CoA synthetase alpha subunit
VPFALVVKLREITSFEYLDAFAENVHAVTDNNLLAYADRLGFSAVLTTDQSMRFQQNMRDRKTGLVVVGSNDSDTLVQHAAAIAAAIRSITRPGKIVVVPIATPRPKSRSRH